MNICCLSKEKIVCIKTEQTNVIFDAKLGIPLLHKCIFSSTHLRDLLSTFNRKLGESSHWLSTLWFSREILMVPKSTHWGMLYVSCCKWERAWRFALFSNYFPLITMDWSCGSSTFVCLYNFLMCLSKRCCCSRSWRNVQIYLQVQGISDLEPIYS